MKRFLTLLFVVSVFLSACQPKSIGWTQLTPANNPPANGGGAAVYNTRSNTAIYLCGNLAETWLWDNGNWLKANPANQPPPRAKFTMAYDESRNKVVIFGGEYNDLSFADTWEWDGKNWTEMKPVHAPPARCCQAMAYDNTLHKILLYGGWDIQTNTFFNDLWLWDGSNWTEVKGHDMPVMAGHKMVTYSSRILSTLTSGLGTYMWDGTSWHNLAIASPPDRPDSALVYDDKHGLVVLYGGKRNGVLMNDTWVFDGTNWLELNLPVAPSSRGAHAMFYDVKRQSIILFGGIDKSGFLGDTWELRLPQNVNGSIARQTVLP